MYCFASATYSIFVWAGGSFSPLTNAICSANLRRCGH